MNREPGPSSLRPTVERATASASGNDTLPLKLNVLVVDDDASINLLLQTRLRLRGHQVFTAANGVEALAIVDANQIDLMMLDVSMPIMGGIEVLTRLRERGDDIAIIMTTAFGSEQVAIEALRQGADDYLRKPFDAIEIKAVLDRTIHRLQLHRQNVQLQQRLDEQRLALAQELARAGEVQRALLPGTPPVTPGYELAARCVPSRDVGGDFYDWLIAKDQLTLVLGDVMGKGMPAALVMATARAALRTVIAHHPPEEVINLVDQALYADLNESNEFITLLVAHLDLATNQLSFVDAGHGHVFILRANGAVENLEPRGMPLGIFPNSGWQVGRLSLEPGDAMIAYSDGLIDSDPDHPLDASIIAAHLHGVLSAAELIDRLILLVPDIDVLPDDLTLLVLRRLNDVG